MLVKANEKDNSERLRDAAIAFGKSNPWYCDHFFNIHCIHCGVERDYDEVGEHTKDCAWLIANQLVQEIESGYFDAPKCRYYGVIYAELEENDEYLYCNNVALPNQYCEEHQEHYKLLKGQK